MTDSTDKATAWDAIVDARRDEREVILNILKKATNQRDSFHVGGTALTNASGNAVFVDATKIDAAIEVIEARHPARSNSGEVE